jgi:hypothetical protein
MTKLDESFVEAGLKAHPEAEYYINTLAREVRRLEELGGRYEEALDKIGRMASAVAVARLALRPASEEAHRSRMGQTVSEQLEALDADESKP